MKFFRSVKLAVLAAMAHDAAPASDGYRRLGRYKVQDTAILFRMGAGVVGTVTRSHPVAIEPTLQDTANPPLGFGLPVVLDRASQGVRAITAADVTDDIFGLTVRVFPFQQTTGGPIAAFGNAAPLAGPIDIMKSGYMLVQVNGTPMKGDPLYIWTAASNGNHVQGGFEATATAGSTVLVGINPRSFYYNGEPDANGVVEIAFNL